MNAETARTTEIPVEILPPSRRLADVLSETGTRPAFNRVLRVAISLRGGVSLAVWLAGALAELDLLRRIRVVRDRDGSLRAFALSPSGEPDPTLRRLAWYARAVAGAGYDEVQFDVIAGASAGGLSTVLYAVAQRAGTGLDSILPVWRDLAGLRELLHPPGLRRVEAPMRGDGYFWRTATRAVAELFARGEDPARSHPDLVPPRVSVHLAATVINSEAESEPDIREGRGHFVFQADDRRAPLPHGIPRAGPDPDREPAELQLLRLAYAARSTSSLPGGFEVARIVSPTETRREVLERSREQLPLAREAIAESMREEEDRDSVFASGRLRPDFAFAFSSHRPRRDTSGDEGPYEVIDGGIFDNVPIDRTLRVIRGSVGETYGDRALLDLDPEPQERTREPAAPRSAESLWTVLAAGLQRVRRRESPAEELEEVSRFNGELVAEQGRLEALATVIADVDTTDDSAEARLHGYLRSVGGTDALFLAEAVSRPSRWQLVSSLPRRRRLRSIPGEHLAALPPVLMADYAGPGNAAERILTLPSSLIDAAHAVLAWARALESAGALMDERELRQVREVRAHVADALDFGRRARDAAAFRVLVLSSRFADTLPEGPVDEAVIRQWVAAWRERGRGEEGQARQDRERAALLAHHRRLDQDIRTLRRLSGPAADPSQEDGGWRVGLWRALDERYAGRELTTLELIALVAPAGMQPPMSIIVTGRISADEQPGEPRAFPTVLAEERRRALQDAIEGRSFEEDALRVTARGKLAGLGAGNLLGLLSGEWRANDWWWGRLDAAAGMVRFLDTRFSGSPDPARAGELVTDAQQAIAEEADGDLRAGADGLGNLSPRYRTALATHALSAVLRSARPALRENRGYSLRRSPWPALAFLLLEVLLRPLLLAVPLIAAPVRLVAALGAVAGLGWGLTRALEPDIPGGLSLLDVLLTAVAAVATALVLAVVARHRVRRWKAISTGSLPRPPGVSTADSEAARRTAARLSDGAGAVAVIAAALLGWSVSEGRLLAIAGWLLVTVAAGAWSIRLRAQVPLLQAPLRWLQLVGAVAAFAVLAAIGPTLDTLFPSGPDWIGLAQLVGFAAVFSVVLVWGWENLGKAALALLAGAALWLLAWLAVLVVALLPDAGAGPGWIPPVAFLVAWSNVLWVMLMLRPARGFPSDAPRRTPSPRWFTGHP